MKPSPAGWPRISSSLNYDDPRKAIKWLAEAFGFETRILVEGPDGGVMHSELVYGDGVIMVSGPRADAPHRKSPRAAGGANTQSIFVYVDDVEAHCARARAAGAKITTEPTTNDYGEEYWTDRSYGAEDLEGHHWWFAERLSDPTRPPPSHRVVRHGEAS